MPWWQIALIVWAALSIPTAIILAQLLRHTLDQLPPADKPRPGRQST
jgi:hypothetical protein